METKGKGKAIIGIAMAAIMVASVMTAMVPTASAALPLDDASYNLEYNTIEYQPKGTNVTQSVLIGQELYFEDDRFTTSDITIKGDPTDSNIASELFTVDSTTRKFDTSAMTKTGIFYVNSQGGSSTTPPTSWDAQLAVTEPLMTLKLKSKGDDVSSITEGSYLEINFVNTLDAEDMVSLVITDPDGDTITSANITEKGVVQHFKKINVSWITSQYGVGKGIDTTDWELGAYTFKVVTKKDTAKGLGARGLEEEASNEKSLTISKSEIAIDADKTSVSELGRVRLTVTGVAGHNITLDTSDTAHTTFPGGVNDNSEDDCSEFSDKIDADGKRTYAVEFDDTGSYTITVKDFGTAADPSEPIDEATVEITVTEKGVDFEMDTTVTIGEKLTVKGTSNTGDWVQIAVDDVICSDLRKLVLDADGVFEKEIDTSKACGGLLAVPGSVRLKAFIDTNYDVNEDVEDKTDDGSIALLMTRGDLKAELSAKSVAQDDDFKISGTAKGSKEVQILIIAPKGSSGSMIDGGAKWTKGTLDDTSIYYKTTTVSTKDDKFEKKIDVGSKVDTGSYLVILITPGSDNKYGKAGVDKLVDETSKTSDAALNGYYLIAKTQEQMLEIIDDAISILLSDDLQWVGCIKVESPFVTLNPIVDVGIGEPLVVTGTTNREEGFSIVVTCKGRVELEPQTVKVENGTFNATFDTSGATVGPYTVKADDGDGHTDDATVDIGEAAEPTATPTATPTPTAIPTAIPTPEPTAEPAAEPTPTEEPGFEAVFAIAGLLSIAYLVLRRRK